MTNIWIYFGSLPTDFQEFEQQLYDAVIEHITNWYDNIPNDKMPYVLVDLDIGEAYENLINTGFKQVTLSRLLKKCKYIGTFRFLYDIKQKRLMQLPNDEGEQYLTFFKDSYGIFTRYWKLDDEKRESFDHLLYMWTRNSLEATISTFSVYNIWKEHPDIFELAKSVLTRLERLDKVF